MSYMCAACSEVYDQYFNQCPKAGCNGSAEDDEIIYVDEMFAPVISMLNKKGYEVKSSYFGNPNNNMTGNPYIVLHEFLYEECGADELKDIFDKLPYPWKLVDKNECPTIEAYVGDRNKVKRFKNLLNAHIALADFVDMLPKLW